MYRNPSFKRHLNIPGNTTPFWDNMVLKIKVLLVLVSALCSNESTCDVYVLWPQCYALSTSTALAQVLDKRACFSLYIFFIILHMCVIFCTCHKLKTCSLVFAYFYTHWCIYIPINTGVLWACHFQSNAAKWTEQSPCYRSMNRDRIIGTGLCSLVREGGLVPL